MTNEEIIIKKLKEVTGKLLTMSKKIKALEENQDKLSSVEYNYIEGTFQPNEKFLSWYEGSFTESVDDVEEVQEAIEEDEEVQEEEPELESTELTETLEQLDEAINGDE